MSPYYCPINGFQNSGVSESTFDDTENTPLRSFVERLSGCGQLHEKPRRDFYSGRYVQSMLSSFVVPVWSAYLAPPMPTLRLCNHNALLNLTSRMLNWRCPCQGRRSGEQLSARPQSGDFGRDEHQTAGLRTIHLTKTGSTRSVRKQFCLHRCDIAEMVTPLSLPRNMHGINMGL